MLNCFGFFQESKGQKNSKGICQKTQHLNMNTKIGFKIGPGQGQGKSLKMERKSQNI